MPRKRFSLLATEDQEQAALIQWARTQPILTKGLYAIPNGGKRNVAEAKKLVDMGVLAGVSDLHLPYPSKGYHGLWIELKRGDGGRLTKPQAYWLHQMSEWGHMAVVCRGWMAAKRTLEDYLG